MKQKIMDERHPSIKNFKILLKCFLVKGPDENKIIGNNSNDSERSMGVHELFT